MSLRVAAVKWLLGRFEVLGVVVKVGKAAKQLVYVDSVEGNGKEGRQRVQAIKGLPLFLILENLDFYRLYSISFRKI
ncbi:unnamed protein product [Enterobius vermicularis]|uniref:Transposase n=1 Tax=Enterobius vermicularis TaxID=51028 RepID=A0A0N4VLI6_ENTVE|nr:unnamed protein product [Enterobius vermicularis]